MKKNEGSEKKVEEKVGDNEEGRERKAVYKSLIEPSLLPGNITVGDVWGNFVPCYDPNHPIKQESSEYHPLGSQHNPICSPYYNDDPFVVLPEHNSPEYHPQSQNSSSQWMDAGSDFNNWNTGTQSIQGNEAQSSQIQLSEEDSSEDSQYYQTASENPDDYPFNNPVSNTFDYQSHNFGSPVMYDPYVFPEPTYSGPYQAYFQSPPEYHNAYNDMLVVIRKPPPKFGEIGNPSVPYNPSINIHSAPAAGSYNITPVYSKKFHEGYAEMPYENKCDPKEEERVDSNVPYIPYYETIPIPALHINENASGREREQMLLNRIAELERENAEIEAWNVLLVQALENKNFRNL
ncbi:hypothetical protein L1987_54203 [Smallanthus sonchifolius]|uniref:Uncharacterized protein n=1 Tax=Smallanthus sonchifolius TaxID=185202 RepID=A0ACB9E6V0_9ASTR|nr:hypothetical protein L1987_54203 [Smallanthus sonchifolius]